MTQLGPVLGKNIKLQLQKINYYKGFKIGEMLYNFDIKAILFVF